MDYIMCHISKLIFAILLGLVPLNLLCQIDCTKIAKGTKEIGKNLITEESIVADTYILPTNIWRSSIDSAENKIRFQLRPLTKNRKFYKAKGVICSFDLNTNEIEWQREVNYDKSLIQSYNNQYIDVKNRKSICVDMETGRDLWTVDANMIDVLPWKNLGLAYKTLNNRSDLMGIDLKSGKHLWTRKINKTYGWRQILPLDTSHLVIVASGMHILDLDTGKGWSHVEKAGKEKFSGDVVYNLSSDALVDSSNIYFATRKVIMNVDRTGARKWVRTLDEKKTGKSFLEFHDDQVLMINTGHANSALRSKSRLGTCIRCFV